MSGWKPSFIARYSLDSFLQEPERKSFFLRGRYEFNYISSKEGTKLFTDVMEVIVRRVMNHNGNEIRRLPFKIALAMSLAEKRSTAVTMIQ